MSTVSQASSPVAAVSGGGARQPKSRWRCLAATLKYLFLTVALVSPYASAFLTYPMPVLADSLHEIRLVCWFVVFLFSLISLFRRRSAELAIFFAAWAWLFFTPYRFAEPSYWLFVEGFRVHASPVDGYLSRCRLMEFVEKGVRQTFGFCEAADMGAFIRSVFYDTTGEFAVPLSQRTAEWKQAVSAVVSEDYLEAGGFRLFGDFYAVEMPLEMFRG